MRTNHPPIQGLSFPDPRPSGVRSERYAVGTDAAVSEVTRSGQCLHASGLPPTRKIVGCKVGSGGGRARAALRSVRAMTTPGAASLQGAESDLQTAQSESDPHRQGQYARSAADTAAEVAVDNATSSTDRERAVAVMQDALTLAARSQLREAQSTLTDARGSTDPLRRQELARSAVSKARQVARHRDLTDDERAAARQVIGHGRMLATTVSISVKRQQRIEREREEPGIAI
jgi:hypothetical protein